VLRTRLGGAMYLASGRCRTPIARGNKGDGRAGVRIAFPGRAIKYPAMERRSETGGGMPYAPAALLPAARGSARLMLRMRQLEMMIGDPTGLRGLDIGGEAGWVSALLRARGGEWTSAEPLGPALESLRYLCGDRGVVAIEDGRLPLKDQTFDLAVLLVLPDDVAEQATWIREVHRVLKPAGRLVISVPFAARISPLSLVCALAGEPTRPHGGFTVARLFEVLKDGFDLQDCRRYSRLLIEWVDVLSRRRTVRLARAEAGGRPDPITLCRAQADAWRGLAWLSWTAAQLDALLFLSPGYRLIGRARRRLWIPRRAPVLSDGRSVAEAALGGRIGTAGSLIEPSPPQA